MEYSAPFFYYYLMEDLYKFVNQKHYVSFHFDTCDVKPPKQVPNDIDDIFSIDPTPYIPYNGEWKVEKVSESEEDYKKNYGNPLCYVRHYRNTIVVSKKENKISLKLFTYERFRNVGKPYFKVATSCKYFTYNYVNNAMYYGYINNYHKKRKFTKRVKRVTTDFNPISQIRANLMSFFHQSSDTNLLLKKTDVVNTTINTFINSIPGIENYNHISHIDNRFYKLVLDKNNVKLPNNWESLIFTWPQPKKKDYIKNKFKYVDALMSVNKLKGDKIRRVLHNITTFNPQSLHVVIGMFGHEFVLSQSDETITSIMKHAMNNSSYVIKDIIQNKKEFNNCFEIFKLVIQQNIHEYTFSDHLRLYSNLKRFEPVKWESKDYDSFQKEHFEWSERNGFYTKGDFTRIYTDSFVEEIEKSFKVNDDLYYPVVLKTSNEYNKESFVQNNCVKGYVNRAESFIISLRKGDSLESKDRATIEYRINKQDDKIKFKRVQTLGRFNKRLTDDWVEPIKKLDDKISKLLNKNMFSLPELIIKLGNKVIKTKSHFVDKNYFDNSHEYLDWEDNISNINSISTDLQYYEVDLDL